MIKPRATIQLTIMELVIGKPKTRVISTAFGDRVCSSRSGVAAGWGACSELPCAATALAGVAEARAGGAPAANAEPALRPTNTARKTSINPAFSLLMRQPTIGSAPISLSVLTAPHYDACLAFIRR